MGYAGKLEEKKLAFKLRRQGLSYNEIEEKVPVSKDTLSRWCRDVILTPSQMGRLRKKRLKGAERGRIIGAKRQQRDRVKRTKKLLEEGKREIGLLNGRDRFIAGVSLYLGDGLKGDKCIGFSNSNSKIISFMMSWFREFCQIPEEKFRGQIWIHDNLDEPRARKYWSGVARIPISRFQKSYIARNKIKSKKIRKQLHQHGVFAVRVSSAEIQRKILGWMSGILGTSIV
jgi:transposase